MRKFNLRQVVRNSCFLLALGLTTFVTSTTSVVGQTILINPALEGGFELGPSFAANGWTVVNGAGVTNQWYVGTVPSGFTNNSAYISSDAGVTNGYSNTNVSVVHFYKDITFPAGETAIGLNFNWKANGETGFWDALIVSIAPTSFTPTAGTTSLAQGVLPAPAVELGRYWLQSTAQTATIQIPPSLSGNCTGASTMRLIFTWKNDGSGGTAPSAAVDNIQLVSNLNSITSAGGTFTIDNTLPLSATNFPSFSTAIAALNGAGACLLNPVTFNVTAGQTFNELPPVITATGTLAIPITFQKSGVGANPIISSTGTAGTTDGSIVISGGDYITFDGIDINNTASSTMEFGYIIRNGSATDGAKNNIIRNATVQMSRAVTTTTSAGILTSTTTVGGGIAPTNATGSNDNNQLLNITVNGAINGISLQGTSGFADLNNIIGVTASNRNTITNIGPVGPTSVSARGIHITNQSGSTVQNTDISAVTSNSAIAQGVFATGCVGNTIITGNTIYGISNQGSTSSTAVAYGMQMQNSTTGTNNIRIANNMIANIFTAFTGTATATRYAIGIHTGVASATSSQSYDVYHNSVSIGTGLTPTYSNTCYEIQNVSAIYRVQNNIFANFTGAQGATARHYTWVTTSATNLGAAGTVSNYNDLYIATDAGVSGFVGRANTTNVATVANWTAAITGIPGTDQNSISFAPVFVNNSSNLHLNFGVTPAQIESAGNNALGIAVDFDGDSRPGPAGSVNGGGTAPDLGADEFDGAPLTAPTVTLNSVTPSVAAQCTAAPRLISVNVANTSGTVVSVNLVYTVNGAAQAPIAMTNTSGTTWEATIPVPTPSNATIAWAVSATNSFSLSGNYVGTTYSDEPTTGVTLAANASPGTVCAGTNSTLTATATKNGIATIGTATNLTGATSQPTAFCNRWSSYRMQTVFTAAELTASGLTAGPITSIGYTITTLGDGATNANFTVKVGTTALSTLTDFVASAGFTTTYPAATYTHAVGLNTITFSTPFVWDGSSNIIIEVSHDGANLTNNAQTFYTTTAGNTVAWSTNGGATGTLSTQRLNIAIGGVLNVPISAISWSDGVGTVGTTNPLVVAPSTTTTYTATASAFGCPIGTANTSVTVNPLPSTPTAANSVQCGTQIPTASVTSTSALPTPTFIWYDAAVAGTALQTSTSTTYTSNVTTTTTFYVSELNTTTGCESARVPVTVTVSAADGISASASSTTICIGSSVTLTAANTNPTPNQSYTYTWSSVANSGANPSVNGSSVTVTPTQPGTYQYDLSGVDGGCNAVANVTVTVDPFTATVAPINVTCNGYNNGSFSVTGSSCGTTPYEYSVDGGGYVTTIPTNLTPGAHTVIVKDANGYLTSTLNFTITEPSTTISAPSGTNATVCQNSLSAQVSATSLTNTPTPQTTVVNFALAAQPTETQTAPGVTISSATLPTLPAGAVITGITLACNGIVPHGGEYQSDVRLGLSGAFTDAAAAGTGTIGFGTVAETPYNYTRAIPTAGFPTTGGTLNVVYWNNFNDVSGGDDATFPLGASALTLTINYTIPTPATISWWDAASAGTQIGTGSPLEAVGTSVLPNTATPGTYTVYAQGEYGGCSGTTRTPVTITVNPTSASTTTIAACGSYTWTNGTNYTTSGTYTQTLTNAVGCDSIATLNLTINMPTSSSVSATACGSYTWAQNSTTYTTSGAYSVTLAGANSVGCDSTITLNLTINQPTTSTVTASACGSYTWAQNSTTYTTSGAYSVTLAGANSNGCDSTITLNLTINQPTSSTISATACGSYTWADNSTTYTTSGTYTTTLAGANSNGCDSTITLNLTINQPTTATVTDTACESYTWAQNGMTYTASGMYNDTITNAAGCDSIITLDLTINMPTTETVTASACESYTWAQNGMTYTVSGMYNDTIANAAGCDSIITLDLTINMPTTETVTASACESYTWAQNGMTYTVSGMYNDTIANAAGCDSIITLDLTITGLPTATATDNGDATITASAGSSYQWIDCTTGQAIAGATSQTYTATANGDYAVVVTNAGGCSDTSSCVTIDYIGLKEITDASIRVFPNPTNNDVFVTMGATEATVEVSDAQGKLLQTVVVKNGEKVSLGTYETGVYFLRIRTANGSTLERIVKQ